MAVSQEKVKEAGSLLIDRGMSLLRGIPESENIPGERLFVTDYIRNRQTLMRQCGEWDRLASPFATPLLVSDWFVSGAQAFCPPNNLAMLTVRSDGQLSAVAPINEKGNFLSHLEFVGSSTLCEPGGLLYDRQESLEALIQAMLETKKTLFLKRLYRSSPEASAIENELKKRSVAYGVREEKMPYVDTTGNWETFRQQQISSSRRSSFRRLHRKAKKEGAVSFEVVAPTEENVDAYLEEVYRIEAANWKGRLGTAMKTHPSLNTFFRQYAARTARQGKLHLFFLKIGGKTVAVQLTVVHSNRLWIYKIGYDEQWSWCSPGFLLMNRVVRFCFDHDLERCEFLGHDEQWLHIWATGFHNMISYSIYPSSVSGVLVRLWNYLRSFYHEFKGWKEKRIKAGNG